MIEGLKLTFSGDELRLLLDERVRQHERQAARWTGELTQSAEDSSEDAVQLPAHMCENEAERHAWRARVLAFMRDHIDARETYRLDSAGLEFGELLPEMPGWLAQEEFEERTAVKFGLERLTKVLDGLACTMPGLLSERYLPRQADERPVGDGIIEETDEFITRRLDLGDGPEVIAIQRK